jgi:hypothetical protein
MLREPALNVSRRKEDPTRVRPPECACICGGIFWTNFREHPFPDVGRLCVMVPLCTDNRLRFSARLDEGAPEVRFEWVVVGSCES